MSKCGFITAEVFLEEWNMLPDYSKEQFLQEFDTLIIEGLITISGMNADGEWLYEITEKGREVWTSMPDSEWNN